MRPPARPRVQPPGPDPVPSDRGHPEKREGAARQKTSTSARTSEGAQEKTRSDEQDAASARASRATSKPVKEKKLPGTTGGRTAVAPGAPPTPTSARTGVIPFLRPFRSREEAPAAEVSSGLTARLAERESASRRRRLRRYVILGSSLVLLLGLAWLLLLSPVFRLAPEEIRITGEGTVIKPGQVEDVVAFDAGTPLTVLDTVGLRRRVMDVPGVRDAKIARDWPRGLTVVLASREPVAAVPDGGDHALVDDEGVQVGRAEKPPKGLPTISVPLGADNRRTLEATLFMLNAIPAEVHTEIKSVSAKSPDAVSMKLRDGATVLWGSTADADLKVRVLEVLRAAKETKKAKVFDVSAPNAPITR